MVEILRGRQHEHDQLRPATGGYLDHLFADLVTVAPQPQPPLTLKDLNAIVAKVNPPPHLLLAHPSRVESLQRAVDENNLRVEVRAMPWLTEDTAYLVPPPPEPASVVFDQPPLLPVRSWLHGYWPPLPPPRDDRPDRARKARARRIHAAYDRRRLARRKRR